MTQTARLTRLLLTGAAALALALPTMRLPLALADPVGPPNVPPAIQVPAGNMVHLVGHATGTQNYACTAPNTWTFTGPQATLYGDNGHLVATHFAVPSSTTPEWQANDGSSVIGKKVAAATVAATAIPWLLLSAVSTSLGPDGGDRLAGTTFIQRVNTTGGLAPTTACNTGDTANVPYTADYYFYQAAESDGGDD